ncbi:MAG: ATP-dependent 6-phosphofructokinase [Thermoanaerobaculia bacterium]
MKKRIGILTGGGDCPGLNAVIRAAVRNAITHFDYDVVGIEQGFEGLIQNRTRPLTLSDIRGILPKGGTLLKTTNRGNPFAYQQRGNGEPPQDRSEDVVRNVRNLGLDGVIAIGGEGTLKIAKQLCDMGVPIVGVPKTIDNDVCGTDYSFGFMTAVFTATEAIDRLHSTAESHNRVMILEVMGRHAGWISLYSGIAGGADIILIPEIPFDTEQIVTTIQEREQSGALFAIIVVAEGARWAGGEQFWVAKESNRLGGVAFQVAEALQQRIDLDIRVTVLGHVQRGGSPIPFDRILATRYGKHAVDLVAAGEFGKMSAYREDEMIAVTINDAIGRLKLVNPDGDLVRTALSVGISMGDGR